MAKRTKTNVFDWAAIQWARLIEEKEGNVDWATELAETEAERDRLGRTLDPTAFLSARAAAILASVGVSFERFCERAKRVWIFSLVLVVALGALVFPLARVDKILEDVNLAGPFVFFLLGQIFFLTTSLVCVAIAAFQGSVRWLRSQTGPPTSAERAVVRFSGLLGWLAVSAIRWGTPLFYALTETKFFARFNALRERRSASEGADDETRAEAKVRTRAAERLLGNLIFSKPRFLAFWSGLLSHLFWASCSVCVLLILVARMQGNRYDYCWRTSLEDAAAVKTCVDFLGAPLEKFGADVPARADVEALFDEETPAAQSDAAFFETTETTFGERSMSAETRTRWSHFLLGVVLFWCVAPRCCLTAAYYFLFRRALRDFRPDLEEPYFRELIERAETYSTTVETDVRQDEDAADANAETAWDRQKTLRTEPVAESILVGASIAVVDAVAESASVAVSGSVPEVSSPDAVSESVPEVSSPDAVSESVPEVLSPVAVSDSVPEVLSPDAVSDSVPEVLSPDAVSDSVSASSPDAVSDSVSDLVAVADADSVSGAASIAVALGFDATLADERWRELFGTARTPVLFGDVAADFALKKAFKNWAKERGADVGLCAVATDVSLPPARQCVIFFRDVLAASCPKARIVVVLSGGEKLRRKFGKTAERGVAERIQDWTDALAELSQTTGVSFEPVFFDAELDLPEAREALRKRLNGEANVGKNGKKRRSWAKWDAAAERIVAECRAIFAESCENGEIGQDGQNGKDGTANEERDRRRVALLCADIFAIYREEVASASASGVGEVDRSESRNAWRENLLARASAIVERSVESGRAFGGDFVETCRANGLDRETLERKLTDAVGLSAKATAFCKNLSPRCALAFGALGVSVPVVATFAPLFAGAASTAAIASTLGSLSTLLPSTLASGATGAALGAVVPKSLTACKRKLTERRRDDRTNDETSENAVDPAETAARKARFDGENASSVSLDAIESATAVVCVAATWAATLELQGWPEDKIVAALPVALRPVEEATFDSPDAAANALAETRNEIRKLREN